MTEQPTNIARNSLQGGKMRPSRPWMPLYINSFILDTLGLETDEIGVYLVLIMLAWRHGTGSVTGDMKELKKVLQQLIANFHGLTFNRIVPKLLNQYFEQREDGRYYQNRVEKELRKAEELSEKQSRNIRKRWDARNKINNLSDTAVIPLQSQSQSQKKDKIDKIEAPLTVVPPSPTKEVGCPKKDRRGTRLPEDWMPSAEAAEAARRLLGDGRYGGTLEDFRDYWLSVPGQKGIKLDWDRTFRRWCRNQHEWKGNDHGKNGNGARTVQDAARDLLERFRSVPEGGGGGNGAETFQLLPPRGGDQS